MPTTVAALTRTRLNAAPLLEVIDARAPVGKRHRLLGTTGYRVCWQARTEGTLTVKAAIRLCAALDLDPAELYGPTWPAVDEVAPPSIDAARRRRLDAAPALGALENYCQRCGISRTRLLGGDRSRLYRAVERARATGTITLQAAETLCDLLEVHPRELWQDDYDRAAFDGCPAGYDPWEGAA
jgi:hypothetical protein